ncbi:hypothetical protein RSJ42_07785 [Methanosarcina hadiensis]|uniref:hypothetical protein n=1 Tax=Methanosarcina hadiensis TaxID=3078083 RepID=UPI00397778F4
MKTKSIVLLLLSCLIFSLGLAQAQSEENSCKSITFINVTPDAFECMKSRLQNYGIDVPPGNEGEISGKGVTGSFEWDGKSLLTITIEEKPFWVSCETADERVMLFVDECKGS